MNNKKVQAQMQIDVSFIGNTTKLVKELQSSFKSLDLSSNLTKQFEVGVSKGFKDLLSNLDKMSEGLSKKGLSTKQYTNFFDTMNTKIQESTKFLGGLKDKLTDIYSSEENKKAIKDLENYKKKLEEINKLASAQKASTTRRSTAIKKMEDETGVQYGISKRMLANVNARKQNKQDLTPNQKEWMSLNGLDEKKLARVLELYKQITAQRNKIESQNEAAKKLTGQSTVNSSSDFLAKQIGKTEGNVLSTESYKQAITQLSNFEGKITQLTNTTDSFGVKFNDEVMPRAQQEAEKSAQGMQTLNEVLSQFGIALSATTIVKAFKDMSEAAFDFYKSLDSALNEIYIVSNLSIDAVNSLKTNFISMAKDTGMALDDITRSAVLFYQQGLNTDEVLEMTEVTSQFAKVAGIDATDAADKLTAAVNGYCLAAEDASLVADKFNKVAAASAADINELSTAFSKAAAQANQAGVSMDNYLAYIATMEEATREAPENIGTSLKTIFSRMQQVKEGGTTEDGDTDVNDVETALKSVGIQLRDTKGELRDLEDVFDELGPKWQSLDRNTQAYLGTIIAGTRQQSRFITLMQNWDRVLDLSEQSADSAGQQALMHAKAMESIKSKLQQFQVAWQEFISNLTDSDFFKSIIETMTKFIGSINSGATPVALMGTAIALLVKNITKLDGPLGKLISKFSGGLGKLKSFNSTTLKMAANYVKNQKAIKQYTSSISANEKAISKLEKTNKKLNSQMANIQSATGLSHEQLMGLTDGGKYADETYQKLSTDVEKNTVVMNLNKQSVIDSRNAINEIVPELNAQEEAYNSVTDSLTNISIGLAGLSAILPGTLGSIAAAGSGITTTFNAAVQGVKLFSTASIASIKAMSAAEKASVILTLISIGVQAVMGVVTAIKALGEAFGNQDKNIAESVESMTDALEKYNNAATTAKAAKNLIKDYQELANKVYLTASEQEKLNDIAQQLGDSLELEVIEDEYGNLSISIQDATDKMEALNKKAKEAREELIKNEQEQIEKYDHNGNVSKFYKEYLTTSRSDIRTAIEDIDTGIDDKDLATSASNVEAIMKNLKNVIIDNSAEMSEAFGGLGIKWSLTEDVQSMIDTFNNADIDASQWNSLYQTFDVLQDRIDSLSYDDTLNVVQGAVESWGKAAGLTTQELKLMTDAIMNSLYSDSNLNKTISKYQDKIDKSNGTSYSSQEELYNKQLKELKKESTTFWNPFKQDEEEKEYESVQKKLRLLKEEKQAYENFKTIQDQINQGEEYGTDIYGYRVNLEEEQNRLIEEYGFSTTQELEKAIKMKDILKQFGDSSAAFFDNVGLFDEDAEGLLEQLQNNGGLSNILRAFKVDEESGTRELTTQLVNIIQNSDDTELKEAAENKLSNVFKNIKVSGTISWGDLSDTLDDASDNLRKMNNLMEEFAETGGFTLDTFADLCDILDSLDLSTIFDTGMMDQYLNALGHLELGFNAATGTITANGDALKSLQEIEEVATKAKIEQTIKSLETDKAALQSTIYGIEAEIAANKVLIEYLKTQGDAEVAVDELKQRGQVAYNNTMQQAATLTAQQYHSMASASSSWAEAAITNAAKVGDALKAAMSGQLGSGNLSAYLSQLVSDIKYADTGSMGELQVIQDKNGNVKAKDAIAALEAYNVKGQNSINNILSQMKGIDQMIGLLNNMKDADLSGLGTDKGKSKEIEKYIGQLKEIYNILNRIQLLEHRLSTLDSYSEVATGERYGQLLSERVDYNEQLLDQYEFLTREQKQFTNGYKDFIQNVDGLQGVFDFDKFGQIIINWDKYNSLQDEAIDGETTLKEKADNVYETYTSMFEDLQGYFDNTIKYYKAVIDLQQEMIDQYMSLQDKAADAIKEIYQKILDTKLDAIDQEKEALEELREAREKARKDQENAKAISGLQTNIQRAMMDTSGASDTAFIKAQQDMNDKLEEIADDKYSEELDNIINRLDEEKDALQEQFDELFDNQAWLYDNLDKNFMMNYDELEKLFTQTEEWNQASPLRQKQLVDEWSTAYHTYADRLQGGDKTIYNIWENIQSTKERIGILDENLKSYISKGSVEIANTIAGWQSNASGSGGSGSGGSKKYTSLGSGSPGSNYTPTITTTDPNLKDTTKTGADAHPYKGGLASMVGSVVELDKNTTYATYGTVNDKNAGSYKSPGWYEQNVTVVDGPKWSDAAQAWLIKINGGNGLGTKWVKASADKYGQGLTKYFHDRRWGKSGTKYATGGFANFTGPAWLDGTPSKPEAVLNALQTEHFIKFTDTLDKMFAGGATANNTSSVSIDTISFNVESMSSAEDGEKAFNAFVDKFKEIGSQSGIKIDSFKNRL
jgi:TP901 family phage tail tape measure protein